MSRKIVEHVQNVEVLILTNCSNLTDAGVSGPAGKISSLKILNHLNIKGTGISDQGIKEAFNFHDLRHLVIGDCKNVTDSGYGQIAEYNSHLEVISLEQADLTDQGLIAISDKAHRLHQLDLRYCPNITTKGLKSVLDHCNFLRHLSLFRCKRLESFSEADVGALNHGFLRINALLRRRK